MSAVNFNLDNLTCIIDNNGFQQTGTNEQIMKNSNIAEKWKSFNWDVYEIDGHNINEIDNALSVVSNKPKLVVAKTIKGKGLKIAEENNAWHHSMISKQQYEDGVKDLNE